VIDVPTCCSTLIEGGNDITDSDEVTSEENVKMKMKKSSYRKSAKKTSDDPPATAALPTLSPWARAYVLREQGSCCRGPALDECVDENGNCLYVCPLKMHGHDGLLIDDHNPTFMKSWYHEFDHIVEVKYGGLNTTENSQALCGICHGTKTSYEKLLNGAAQKCKDSVAGIIYGSLSKPKK